MGSLPFSLCPPQILEMARQRGKRVKVVGGGHSPSDIACTDDFMIQMGKMNRILKVRSAVGQVVLSHFWGGHRGLGTALAPPHLGQGSGGEFS